MIIWYFPDAPAELRALSPHGGDEDYLAYVPYGTFDLLEEEWFGRIEEDDRTGAYTRWEEKNGTMFGRCSVSRTELDNGARVYIGAHA